MVTIVKYCNNDSIRDYYDYTDRLGIKLIWLMISVLIMFVFKIDSFAKY